MSEITLNNAVERQQYMLAQVLPTEIQLRSTRTVEFEKYLALLSNPGHGSKTEIATLATKFALTQSYSEAVAILDAGGDIYGL